MCKSQSLQQLNWLMSLAQLVVGGSEDSRHFLHIMPAINFSQLVQCLVRAQIWQRVTHFRFSCEQWVGQVSHHVSI